MLILKILVSFLSALNEKASPRAMAGGFALGAIIGLTPKGSPHNAAILLLIFLLPLNKSAALVSAAVFSVGVYALDPFFNRVGDFLLTRDSLLPLWTALYNAPAVPWTRFNNTLVLGSLVVALILSVPLFLGGVRFVVNYRERVVAAASRWKLFQLVKASKIYTWYERLS